MAVDYGKWAKAGAMAGLVTFALAWLYSLLAPGGLGTLTFSTIGDINVRNQVLGGLDTSLSTTIVNALGGNFNVLPSGWIGAVIIAMLAGIALAVVGRFIYNLLPLGKTPQSKFVLVFLYGSIVGGWAVSLMTKTGGIKIPPLNVIFAMVIYFLIVAFVYQLASKTDMVGKYFQIPE